MDAVLTMLEEYKICNECRKLKLEEEFYKHSGHSDGITSDCQPCTKIKVSKATGHNERSWKRQGIDCTNELYNNLFLQQNGCCGLCGVHQSSLNKRLYVDHNHLTGQIRGLLCTECNFGLGKFKSDTDTSLLKLAIIYIGSSNAKSTNG